LSQNTACEKFSTGAVRLKTLLKLDTKLKPVA